MIRVNVHTEAGGLRNDLPLTAISDALASVDDLLWIDVVEPSAEDILLLKEEFHFHPLALEDVTRGHHRPKLDQYDGYIFMVFYGLDSEEGRPCLRELYLFAGKNYLVTIHDGKMPEISQTADRWCRNIATLGNRGVGLLVYSLLDAIVDGYFPVIDEFGERVEALEESIFAQASSKAQSEIFAMKKDLMTIRRVLGPQRDVMNLLVRHDTPLFGAEQIIYFQDVYDHTLRVTDAVDSYRDLLSSALDVNLSMISFHLNEVVKRLTGSSIILMSVTLIAGIYGMNFDRMPELGWVYGYPAALALMVVVASSLFILFRRIDWI